MPIQKQTTLTNSSLKVLDNFKKQEGVSNEHYQNLLKSINASPLLVEQFNKAVEDGHLSRLKALPPESNMGGGFYPGSKEIALPLYSLENSFPEAQNEVIFVLAHEIQHSFNHKEMEQARQKFLTDIDKQAKVKDVRDYTDELNSYIRATRWDEASAEIAGFNALVSKGKLQATPLTLDNLYNMVPGRIKDFIDRNKSEHTYTYTLKPGLTLEPDMTLSADKNKPNLEIMAQSYYDKGREVTRLASYCEPTGCKPNDYVDYTNYYATWMVGRVIDAERRHNPDSKEPLVLDMQKLKLTEEMLEENGLFIEDRKPMPYKDIGQNPPFVGRFDHTGSGKNQYQYVSVGNLREEQNEPKQSRTEALIAKYQAAATMDVGNPDAGIGMARANPAVQKIMERFDAELERRQSLREWENNRYSLANMPDRAHDLHAQITDKLTAYVKENNLPYSREGLQNSITALAAEAFDQKMTKIDHIAINEGRLMVKQDGRFIHDFAEVDSFRSRLTPERDSFQNIVQSEQKHEHEEQQHEMERQMERSRSMVMGR